MKFAEVMKHSVLLDTSFFIRLLNPNDPLHNNALGYFRYYLENDHPLICSTITIAEYCVRGRFDELPWKNLRVLPFNASHAIRAGKLAEIVFRKKDRLSLQNRNVIPNDSKLFAQSDVESTILEFVTSDVKCQNIIDIIKKETSLSFKVVNIRRPFSEIYGTLDFGE